jgi:carboxyl-terminal processing protease
MSIMTGFAFNRVWVPGVLALCWFVSPVVAEQPLPLSSQFESKAQPLPTKKPSANVEKPASAQLRERAAQAEKAGDWEAAFSAYCEMPIAERSVPEVRERLNAALRRVQQMRRHRDISYQQFVNGLGQADAVNLFAEITAKVPGLFADPAKAKPKLLWSHGIEELDRALASSVFRQTFLDNSEAAKIEAFRRSLRAVWGKRAVLDSREARAGLKQLLAAAQDAFTIHAPAVLAVEFVSGACSGLDEYTVFLHPSHPTEAAAPVYDLSAYGISLRFENGSLFVDDVLPGSWAAFQAQQIRKGDHIVRINGQSMDMTGLEAIPEALRMAMSGAHEIELPGMSRSDPPILVRLPVVLPAVWHRVVGSKGGIGHIRIGEFHATTARDLDIALAALKAQDVRALLVDLRGNRGGSFVAAVEVAKRFLPAGLIVSTQGQIGEVADRVFSSDFGMRATDLPVVVLIDSETASAAEVVAAALRDNQQRSVKAVLVGMPTFGKGTIQYPLKLAAADDPDDRGKPRGKSGTVRLTIARLLAPNGAAINGAGIHPDFLVPDPARQWEVALERAVDLLQPMRSPMPSILPPSQ